MSSQSVWSSKTVQGLLFPKTPQERPLKTVDRYEADAHATLYLGDRLELLRQIPDGSARLIVTSPPYNLGKKYEKRTPLDAYLDGQKETITECCRVLADDGSICWQVGNHVDAGEIFPLDVLLYPMFRDLGLKLRNRIVWTFEHGLHCTNRFSGRYETIIWFTKSDEYVFDLDTVRIPQKYPGKKYYKGPNMGKFSSNPLGKNPGDVWDIPNVKHNHPEKTDHPCQFPIELIERLVLSMTKPGDLVVDPYIGVGSAGCAAVLHQRRAAGADTMPEYIEIARTRITDAYQGTLRRRALGKPIYEPSPGLKILISPFQSPPEANSNALL